MKAISYIKMKMLKLLRMFPGLVRFFYPSYSWCSHCGLPWKLVKERIVWINHQSGHFSLCVDCFSALSENDVANYYRISYSEHHSAKETELFIKEVRRTKQVECANIKSS